MADAPAGLAYQADFITEDEERQLVDFLESLDFHEVTMRGQTARRTVRHFGFDYAYESGQLTPGEPLPEALEWLRDRCAAFAEREPADLVQTLVSRYPPGATIGWHRDAPMFGRIVGVSLLSPSRMRFQRRTREERQVYELELAPRSAYLLRGSVRWAWQHSIPPTKALRYSITFRTLKEP